MPDETKETPAPTVDANLETIKEIAANQKKVTEAFMQELAAQRSSSTPVAVGDPAAEFDKLKTECDALIADGHGTEAMAKFAAHFQKQQPSVDPTTLPAYKHMVETTRRDVRADNKAVFDRWGAEVSAIVDKLPPEKRLLHDEWEDAVRRVRGNHLDEIIAEQEKEARARIEEEYKNRLAPLAGGSRGGSNYTGDNEDAAIAAVLGVSPEHYTASKKAVEDYHGSPDFFEGKGYPLFDERLPRSTSPGARVIKKGAF
jgi:hypothetical protein